MVKHSFTLLPGWSWLPGMLVYIYSGPRRVLEAEEHDFLGESLLMLLLTRDAEPPTWSEAAQVTLMPEDPATGGCLLSLLGDDIEVWKEPGVVYLRPYTTDDRQGPSWSGATLGEACVSMASSRGYWRKE